MKKEYIFTKDNKLKTKEYLDLCFDTKISFNEFNEGYEKYRKYIDPEVVLKFHDSFELHKLAISQYQESEVLEAVKIEDNKVTFSAVNYVRYLILATLCNSWDCNNKMRNEIGLLLMRDMTEIYTAKGEQGSNLLAILKHYSRVDPFRFYMYTDYIKYNHDSEYKGGLKYKKWRIELINRKLKEDPKLLDELNDIKYERELEKNNILNYIIYCTLFLGEDLYIVYYDINEWGSYNIKITDKNRLGNYLSDGVYVLNVSSIILNFYNTVVIHAFYGTDFLELAQKKRKSEQEWEKLFHDILEDSKSKNKITFNVESKDESPVFMSSKWIEQDLNKYKLIEDELGENGEITKKRSKGKWNALGVVKRRVYGSKKTKNKR